MDNLGSHKGHAVRHAIRQMGARLLFLPKYSPDPNPIEQLFAKLKHWLCKATPNDFRDAIADILIAVPKTECSNYFRNAGYG